MDRCILHIGTHKTGTSALQVFFQSEQPEIAERVLYPRAGRAFAGHHNVAWELIGDARFDPRRGRLDDLVDEMKRSDRRASILSSEDFEYLHVRPDAVRRLAAGLQSAAREVVVVVYLRDQVSYAESLYAEMAKHGLAERLGTFLGAIERDGAFTFEEKLVFAFDYERLLEPFARAFGEDRLVVRPYPVGDDNGAIARDFFAAVGWGLDPAIAARLPRVNVGVTLREVLDMLRSNAGGAPIDDSAVAGLPFRPIGATLGDAFARRFADGNAEIERRYGVAIPPRRKNAHASTDLQFELLEAVGNLWGLT